MPEGSGTDHHGATTAELTSRAEAARRAVDERTRGHASAVALDTYADLVDDDLGGPSDALHQAVSATSVGRMWATGPEAA